MLRHAFVTTRIARGVLLAAGAVGVAGAAAQTRTYYSLNVSSEVERDSNPNMTVGESRGTTWLRVLPNLTAGYVLGGEEFALEAGLTAEKSSNPDVARDRVDPRVRGVWTHTGAADSTQLAVLVDRRALRSLDVRDRAPAGVDGTRTLYSVSGNWKHELDARSSMVLDLRQDRERYDEVRTPDFQLTAAAARFSWQQDERRTWYAGVNGQHYRPEALEGLPAGPENEASTTVGALAGITQQLSDALRVDANAGPLHRNRPSNNGWQGALSADYTGERWSGGVSLARSPGVNSFAGGLVVSNDVRARLRYELGQMTYVELSAAYNRQSDPDTRGSFASASWVRQWTPAWRVAVRASTHRDQGSAGTARSNRIALVLTYSATDL